MPGGPSVKGIAAAVVLALIIGQASPRRREKATVQGGGPAGLMNLPARFELYEDGIQIARGEEGSFWDWGRIDAVQDQRGTLVLKKDKRIVTLLPLRPLPTRRSAAGFWNLSRPGWARGRRKPVRFPLHAPACRG